MATSPVLSKSSYVNFRVWELPAHPSGRQWMEIIWAEMVFRKILKVGPVTKKASL